MLNISNEFLIISILFYFLTLSKGEEIAFVNMIYDQAFDVI